ncbi:trypsin-like peptidase domain-containing protein [Aquimarina sp. 2201CG5-10]|uniref:trypsin-like peptidase domain-containing protein n=1 Tax=Aquimarina callyspongiae TaxID=3098150 RepID=UPI002AB48138|nr:trypsin-like peptidase domain-containing protein [Aquimarina sp. 2201CG5-10]MDY8137939.1 T9SS type A sorting domain-containing protein [Aquimarina sp. 2201CG5-10]
MNFHNTNSINVAYSAIISRLCSVLCVIGMLLPVMTTAQTNELKRHYEPYNIQLQSESNQKSNTPEIINHTITKEGAIWLRLFFKDVNLGANSTLTITSALDGATQVLTSTTIKTWRNTSAYFNGNKIKVTLSIAPGERSVGLNISEIGVGDPVPAGRTICGSSDDRIDSTDNAIGRIVPNGCTGWIITNGRLVTAGHCVSARAEILEFNVPKSNPDRTIVHPGPEDQYPIQQGDFVTPYTSSPSQANDWAVFTVNANTQTGLTPIQAQGKSFNVVQTAPGGTIRITGFGTDDGIDNQTQQTNSGPLSSVDNTFVRYRADTTGGNSGSPIIDEATGNAIGVHAYGGCTSGGGSNSGERATIPAFWDAMGLDGNPPPPPGDCSGDISSFPYSESFEGTIGDWTQASGDDLDWTVDSNGTPSNGTGPSSAIDGNSYIYVEASVNGTGYPNKNAILNSPCLNFSGLTNPTLSFQYHMIGSSVGTFNVEARTDNTGNWVSVFNRSGAQGTDWNAADVDLSAYAGEASVQLRLNVVTGSSWQGDITVDALSISDGGTPPPPACDALNFNDFTITPFSNQDAAGDFSVGSGGAALSLTNNTWKYIAMNYTVTANTVIEFDFSSTSQGEIHAVGFENDNTLTSTRYFKVHGTQNYGVTNFDNYSSGTTTYTIPVGNFYTGSMDRLVFINDNDGGSGNNSTFSNVKIYEGSCNGSLTEAVVEFGPTTPILGDEDEGALSSITLSPNPTNDSFTIYLAQNATEKAEATIYTILGQKKEQFQLKPGVNTLSASNLSLQSGIYLVKIESNKGESISKKLIIK